MGAINNNIIPYLLMFAFAYFGYQEHLKAKQAEADRELIYDNMSTIQSYNERKFDEIRAIKKEVWKEGHHETVLNINL